MHLISEYMFYNGGTVTLCFVSEYMFFFIKLKMKRFLPSLPFIFLWKTKRVALRTMFILALYV